MPSSEQSTRRGRSSETGTQEAVGLLPSSLSAFVFPVVFQLALHNKT